MKTTFLNLQCFDMSANFDTDLQITISGKKLSKPFNQVVATFMHPQINKTDFIISYIDRGNRRFDYIDNIEEYIYGVDFYIEMPIILNNLNKYSHE
jgi:hypothetical protein